MHSHHAYIYGYKIYLCKPVYVFPFLFVAYNGTPCVPIHKPLLTKESCYVALLGITIAAIIILLFPWNLYRNYPSFLKMHYMSITNPKWPPLSSELYIPLAAVEMEGVSPKDADEFTQFSLYYSPEQILKKKRQIIFDDLLKPTQHSDGLKFVLVEGAPGIGKSTLAKEICQRWSTNPTADNHLKQFFLVILVQLRDIQHPTTLYDLLPKDPNTNMKEIEQQLHKTYGQNVLWILDGFDELLYEQRQQGSFYRHLIEGDILKQSIVLVTSRPTASGSLVHLIKRIDKRAKRIEIVGFNSSRIQEYGRHFFKDHPDRLPFFINYYNSTPVIKRLMYIPLNAAIVCLVYNESYARQLQFPTTMTELYNAFTQALILRHLLDMKQVHEDFGMPSRLMCEEDLNNLPEKTQKEFWKLTKVAYDGVRTQQYIFNNTMMTDIKDNLGLMSDISGFSVSSGTQNTSSFLHTTLQEYLAALYIANKPKEFAKQVFLPITEHLQKPWIDFTNESAMRVEGYILSNILNEHSKKNLEVVLVFYAGITGKLQIESDDHTFTVLSELEVYSTLFARCIYESSQLSTKYQNRHLLNNWDLSMEPLDYYIVGYLISHYNISLDVGIISGDSYDFIAKSLLPPPKKLQGQLTLEIYGDLHSDKLFQLSNVTVKGLHFYSNIYNSHIIQATKSFPNLTLLHITSPMISCNKTCVHIQTFDYLEELDIILGGTYEELSALLPLIQSGRPIKHLRLTLHYHDCPPLDMLFYPSSLESIELRCYPFRNFSNKCEIDFNRHLISQNTNLTELKIHVECPSIIFSLATIIQVRSLKLEYSESSINYFILQRYELLGFEIKPYQCHPCSRIHVYLLSYKYLKELSMLLNGTCNELSSIIPLIQPGRPLKYLQLYIYQWTGICPPSYMLFYPSSLEKLSLFCDSSEYLTCKAHFNTSLISQNTNLKKLLISVNCPYWDTILLSLAIANTSKLESLITYHYNDPLLITSAASSKLHYHLINLHYLEELAITINGTDNEISSIVQLIQPGRLLRYLRLTLVSYGNSPPIHMLLYPSSLKKLELLCYDHVNVKTSFLCELNFNKNLISQNTNLKELVITTSCPCIDTFSSLLVKNKTSLHQYVWNP